MGKRRRVKLIDPLLRVAYKAQKNDQKSAASASVSDMDLQLEGGMIRKSSHSWPSNAMTLGEMSVVGFGGADPDDITYQLDIMLTRKWYVEKEVFFNKVAWPSGLRRQLQALVRKGAGSNPAAIIFEQ